MDQQLEVKMILDKPFTLDDFVNNTSDVQHIC
jgi:hypothetical protein